MKLKKINKLKRMQVHTLKSYWKDCYSKKITEIYFPKCWNKNLIKQWLNNNGYEEFYYRGFEECSGSMYERDWKFRKNKAYIIECYDC